MHDFIQKNNGKQEERAKFGLKFVHKRKKWLKIGHAGVKATVGSGWQRFSGGSRTVSGGGSDQGFEKNRAESIGFVVTSGKAS